MTKNSLSKISCAVSAEIRKSFACPFRSYWPGHEAWRTTAFLSAKGSFHSFIQSDVCHAGAISGRFLITQERILTLKKKTNFILFPSTHSSVARDHLHCYLVAIYHNSNPHHLPLNLTLLQKGASFPEMSRACRPLFDGLPMGAVPRSSPPQAVPSVAEEATLMVSSVILTLAWVTLSSHVAISSGRHKSFMGHSFADIDSIRDNRLFIPNYSVFCPALLVIGNIFFHFCRRKLCPNRTAILEFLHRKVVSMDGSYCWETVWSNVKFLVCASY